MKKKENVYKEETVEAAIAAGLADLGLTEEEANIEIVSEGGKLKKASVCITPKEAEEKEEVESVCEVEEEETEVEEEISAEELEEAKDKAYDFVNGLIQLMGVDCETTAEIKDNSVYISITGPEARIIIGRRGDVLDAIQFIAMTNVNEERRGGVRVIVDAENYRERRLATLKRVAESNARKALKYGEIIELEPMNAYERRIIHTTLASDDRVTTRSEGEGRDRHLIIVPLNEDGTEIENRREERYKSSFGTSSDFRRKGTGKLKSYGQPKRRF